MNQWKIEKINIGASNIQKIKVTGNSPGPWVHIQSSVHGAEVMGNKVIHLLMEYFKENPINGRVTLIPHANPFSEKNKNGTYTTGRFCPITGDNWNRIYADVTKSELFEKTFSKNKSKFVSNKEDYKKLIKDSLISLKKNPYGQSRGKELGIELQIHASDADIFLDLHTGPVAAEYLYVSERQKDMSSDLPFTNQIIIPNEFDTAGDEAFFIPWSKLEKETDNDFICGESYTVELGSEETINHQDARDFTNKILYFLHRRKIIKTKITEEHKNIYQRPLHKFKTYFCQHDGLVDYIKKPGENVKKGEVLYTILNLKDLQKVPSSNTVTEVSALADGVAINHSPSANMLQGMEIYQILES